VYLNEKASIPTFITRVQLCTAKVQTCTPRVQRLITQVQIITHQIKLGASRKHLHSSNKILNSRDIDQHLTSFVKKTRLITAMRAVIFELFAVKNPMCENNFSRPANKVFYF
jgi:hypothetical protein